MTQTQHMFDWLHQELADEMERYVKSRLLPQLWTRFGEEIVPETFCRLFKDWSRRGLAESNTCDAKCVLGKVRPIIYGILKIVMQEMIRATKRHDHESAGLETVADDNESRTDVAHDHLEKAKKLCSKAEWTIFELMANENLGSNAIGERLGMKPESVRGRIHRARKRLRKAVDRGFM